jgi:hypothetical protein
MMHTQPGWSGYSVANPEYESKEMYKAVSWAVHSSQLTQDPTLTVLVLPAWKEGSHTAYLKWTRTCPSHCRLLATIPRKAFKFIPPETNTMGQEATSAGNPDWDINLLLVGNPQGFEAAFGPHPRSDHSCPQNRHHPGHQCPLNTQTP